jgi:hypothetical protein
MNKYYSFDLDDNILKMNTKIYMKDVNNNIIEVSTDDFVEKRNDPNYKLIEWSFKDFKDKDKFLIHTKEAIENKQYAVSYNDFKKCLINGSLFSIITARGHEPEVIRNGIKYFINNVLSETEYFNMLNNLSKKEKEYNNINIKDSNMLIDRYLNYCRYYPINSEYIKNKFKGIKTQEDLKKESLKDFKKYIESFGNKYIIGFSDDDINNIKIIKNENLDNVKIYYTKKEKYFVC